METSIRGIHSAVTIGFGRGRTLCGHHIIGPPLPLAKGVPTGKDMCAQTSMGLEIAFMIVLWTNMNS